MQKEKKMKNKYLIFLLCVSWTTFGINAAQASSIPELIQNIKAHMVLIQNLKADIKITTSGTGKIMEQKGRLEYISGQGTTFRLDGDIPMEVKITERGTVYINGEQQAGTHTTGSMGDIFFLSLLNQYSLRIISENNTEIQVAGYDPSDKLNRKKVLLAIYNKKQNVITRIDYLGGAADYPYRMNISYTIMQGIPIATGISTHTSAYSITVSSATVLENIALVKKE